jgi:hypothetical protein
MNHRAALSFGSGLFLPSFTKVGSNRIAITNSD